MIKMSLVVVTRLGHIIHSNMKEGGNGTDVGRMIDFVMGI